MIRITGLRQAIAAKQGQAASEARRARAVDTDPRDAYECGVLADKLTEEAEKLGDHVRANEQVIEGIEQMIHYLVRSPATTDIRDQAKMHLMEASALLMRENGAEEPKRDFRVAGANHPNGNTENNEKEIEP